MEFGWDSAEEDLETGSKKTTEKKQKSITRKEREETNTVWERSEVTIKSKIDEKEDCKRKDANSPFWNVRI